MKTGQGKERAAHCGGLELTRVSARAKSSCDRNMHVAMVANVFLSEEDEISPEIVKTTKRDADRLVESKSGQRREREK